MKKEYMGYLYIVLTAFIFSTMEIALKMVSGVFAPMQITMLRFVIGGFLLVPMAVSVLKKKDFHPVKSDLLYFALLGFLCVTVSMVLYQMAVTATKASVVAVVFSGNAIFVTFIAYFVLREAIHKSNIIALAFEIIAILCIMDPLNATVSVSGVVLSILAAIFFALYGVLGKKRAKKYGSIVITCFSFIFGGFELLFIILLGYLAPVASFFQSIGLSFFVNVPILDGIEWTNLPVFFYICAVNSAAGYVCYMLAMEHTSAKKASVVFFLKPIIAPILAFLVIHEEIGMNMIVGILFFLCGSLVLILPGLINEKRAKQ